MLENAAGVPLPLKGGAWKAPTKVERERQLGHRWCWVACVAMVLKAFGNYKGQCKIAKDVFSNPCIAHDKVNPDYDRGYKVDQIEALWRDQNGVPAKWHAGAVKWDVIERELKPDGRPVQIFLGVGNDSKDGHLVLIVGAEKTAAGRRLVSIADPISTDLGFAPTDFDSLETELKYGKWSGTWTNLFWKKKVP